MSRLFEPDSSTDVKKLAIEIRRAAITQIRACDAALGWQTEITRITENGETKIHEKADKRNSG